MSAQPAPQQNDRKALAEEAKRLVNKCVFRPPSEQFKTDLDAVFSAIDRLAAPAQTPASAVPPKLPDVLFDRFAVWHAMSPRATRRTSPENVNDVLDAVVKLLRAQFGIKD